MFDGIMSLVDRAVHRIEEVVAPSDPEPRTPMTRSASPGAVPPIASLGEAARAEATASDRAYGQGQGQARTSTGLDERGDTRREPPEITRVRDLLIQLDPSYADPTSTRGSTDPAAEDRLLDVIRQVLDRARQSDPELARRYLDLVRRYGIAEKYPVVATAIAEIERSLAHVPPPTTAGGGSAAPAASAGFDWSTLISHGHVAVPSAAEHTQLAAIAAARPAKVAAARAARGQHLHKRVAYQGVEGAGWQYSNPANPGAQVATGDRVLDAAANELFHGGQDGKTGSIEATAGGVVTYDGTLSIGSGWANGAAADYVGRWLDKDPAARALLLDLGFTITADHTWAVVTSTGQILVGEDARTYLRAESDGGILDVISGLIEDPAHNSLAMAAQTDKLQNDTIGALKDPIKTAMQTWTREQIGAAIHLTHWNPQGGPVVNPNDYAKTGGDPLRMIHAFAVDMHRYVQKPNGAYVLGADVFTAQPITGHFDRFGDGLFLPAIAAATAFDATFDEVATNPAYAGHVILVDGAVKAGAPGTHRFRDFGKSTI